MLKFRDSYDELHEECGVLGIYGVDGASRHAFVALEAIQHRGQQACGIAVCGPDRRLRIHKGAGLVKDVFPDDSLSQLQGDSCIGHVRYPTTAVGGRENIQPFSITCSAGTFAFAHNGNIVNADVIKSSLESQGHLFQSTSDSELFAHLIGMKAGAEGWEQSIMSAANLLDGAFSTVILAQGALYACRDKYGFRPLSIGRLAGGYVVASETCALDALGAEFLRDIDPGELVAIGPEGLKSYRHSHHSGRYMCAMEYIYFARPDSDIEGCNVHAFRKRTGRLLFEEHPVRADIVVGVPDSSISAAMGYSEASHIPLERGLLKNIYVARTFIQPAQSMRDLGVRMKMSPIRSVVEGKSIALIDDSIVRGTTSRQIVRLLRDAGAREVHMLIASPKYAWPCFYGIDTGTSDQLIGADHDEEEICGFIGADSLHYLSAQALLKASCRTTLCTACFTGNYPTALYGQEQ
ncbi:MAG: amidophosphoribosyltransferase [Bacteroidales bacterium]|nr:amidophosphoribosyltransferase [Bacteroidales bacterium]